MSVELVCFADSGGRWKRAATRLSRQASKFNFIDQISLADESWLTEHAPHHWDVKNEFAKTRGYGFWRWKPLLVAESIERTSADFVLYLDAGCELNINTESTARFQDYLEWTKEYSLLLMKQDTNFRTWCKSEAWMSFGHNQDSVRGVSMLAAGVILARANSRLPVIERWLAAADERNGFLFDDAYNPALQIPEFQEHRHDQSVLSLVAHDIGLRSIPDETYFHGNWNGDATKFPIWTMRNPNPFSRRPGTPFGDLSSKYRRLRNRVKSTLAEC